MPHITSLDKTKYNHIINAIFSSQIIETKGDLEFLVYQLMKKYMSSRPRKYLTLHDAVYGTIHSAEEFKRLHLDKRENEAISENGEA